MTPSPAETLQSIQERLHRSMPVPDIIEELLPFTLADAVTWARRLPFWDEFRAQYSGQAIALARIVSKRTLREFGLAFDAEGRVIEEQQLRRRGCNETPTKIFAMQIGEDTVEVRYTQHYLPISGDDLISFVGAELPPPADPSAEVFRGRKPHALSATGWWSQYIPAGAVEACGGPERYAQLYAEAKMRGEDKQLEMVFQGERPEGKSPQRKKLPRRRTPTVGEQQSAPVVGQHTAAVVEERQEKPDAPEPSLRQRGLFS